VLVASSTLIACGGGDSGVPDDAVAKVKDTAITKAAVDHWMTIAATSQQAQAAPGAAAAKPSIPTPPDFTACIAKARASMPKKLPKGQTAPTDVQLKETCKQQYEALKGQVVPFLISAAWITGEAKDQGIAVSDAEVKKQFETQKKQSYPKEADFQKFLKGSGMTLEDLLFRVKVDTLSQKIRDKVTKGATTVTPAAIKAYYAKNKAKFGTPEQRDVHLVLTKTKAKADAAKAAVQGGQSWKSVAKKYSLDEATKANGGVLSGVTKGQQDKALDAAIFSAKKNAIVGPVKTQFGYYVVQPTKITAAVEQTLAQAQPQVKQLLQGEGQQKALDKFVKDFQKKWKADTECAAGYDTIPSCKNEAKPKTATATTPTSTTP